MSARTKIPWADATWNPMTGCTPVSEACEHCYAERIAGRNLPVTRCPDCVGGYTMPGPAGDLIPCDRCNSGDLADEHPGNVQFTPTFHPDRLDVPLHWRKPRRIFVCSMSDLFHEAFTGQQINEVWRVMFNNPRHTFMVLTKRPERLRLWTAQKATATGWPEEDIWPDWMWLGVTAENQQRADERIPILLDTPATVRFVSIEPMLGQVDLTDIETLSTPTMRESIDALSDDEGWVPDATFLDWVIVGGENGPGARPMQPEWPLAVWRQCKASGTPFFWKQHGSATRDVVVWMPKEHVGELYEMRGTRELPGGGA